MESFLEGLEQVAECQERIHSLLQLLDKESDPNALLQSMPGAIMITEATSRGVLKRHDVESSRSVRD